MSRFIESLTAKVRHNRACAKERDPSSPDTDLRYVWAREASQDGRVHYHVAILLNRDAFFTLGGFKSEVQHLQPCKVRRCKAPQDTTSNFSLKSA